MSQSAHRPDWLKFLKPKYNFFQLLNQQASTTLDGTVAFTDWLNTNVAVRCQKVHDLEHQADRQKMQIEKALSDTVFTPFDREEIYDISARLDLVINGIKRVVKDIEAYEIKSVDPPLKEMGETILEGMKNILVAVDNLEKDLKTAESSANASRKTESRVGDIYRRAMKSLLKKKNIAELLQTKALYDSMWVIAERIERLGETLLHLSIKAA